MSVGSERQLKTHLQQAFNVIQEAQRITNGGATTIDIKLNKYQIKLEETCWEDELPSCKARMMDLVKENALLIALEVEVTYNNLRYRQTQTPYDMG